MSYREELIKAIWRTKKFGLELPPFIMDDSTLLDNPRYINFDKVLSCAIPHSSHDRMANHCFDMTHLVQRPLSEYFECEALFTLGYFQLDGKEYYYNTEDDLNELLNNANINNRAVNLHAWITLPSMEIIDVTIGSTVAFLSGNPV